MQHRGEIVEKAVRESGYSITKLAKLLRKSRRWMYLAFQNRNLPVETVVQIGHFIHHDFSQQIKDVAQYRMNKSAQVLNERGELLINPADEAEHWKNKYLELLEKYNQLLLERPAVYPSLRSRKKK